MSKEPDSGGIIVVVFFFRQSGKKKLPQKVLTHSFFEVFVLKVSFPGKKKYETFVIILGSYSSRHKITEGKKDKKKHLQKLSDHRKSIAFLT